MFGGVVRGMGQETKTEQESDENNLLALVIAVEMVRSRLI